MPFYLLLAPGSVCRRRPNPAAVRTASATDAGTPQSDGVGAQAVGGHAGLSVGGDTAGDGARDHELEGVAGVIA
jgi:hypothetical protein